MTFEGREFLEKIKIEASEIIENEGVNSLEASNIKVEEDNTPKYEYFDSFCDNIKVEIDESAPEQHNISSQRYQRHNKDVNNEIPFVEIKVEEFLKHEEETLSNCQENNVLVSNEIFPIDKTENVFVDTTIRGKDTDVNNFSNIEASLLISSNERLPEQDCAEKKGMTIFKCVFCGKSFVVKSDLKKHLYDHKGIEPCENPEVGNVQDQQHEAEIPNTCKENDSQISNHVQ